MTYLRSKRSVKELAQLGAKWWSSYVRDPINGYESSRRIGYGDSAKEKYQEVVSGFLVDRISKTAVEWLRKEGSQVADEYESILSDLLLNGMDMDGRKIVFFDLTQDRHYLAIGVDYHPDRVLVAPFEKILSDRGIEEEQKGWLIRSFEYFFPFKTRSYFVYEGGKSGFFVSCGYGERRKEVLDDLTMVSQDADLNFDLIYHQGFDYAARRDDGSRRYAYVHPCGAEIASSVVSDYEHGLFKKLVVDVLGKDLVEGRVRCANRPSDYKEGSNGDFNYYEDCSLEKGHDGSHRNNAGYEWE